MWISGRKMKTTPRTDAQCHDAFGRTSATTRSAMPYNLRRLLAQCNKGIWRAHASLYRPAALRWLGGSWQVRAGKGPPTQTAAGMAQGTHEDDNRTVATAAARVARQFDQRPPTDAPILVSPAHDPTTASGRVDRPGGHA